jgi:hypothetical protein
MASATKSPGGPSWWARGWCPDPWSASKVRGAIPIDSRLICRRVKASRTLSWPANRLCARIGSGQKTLTGSPHRLCFA